MKWKHAVNSPQLLKNTLANHKYNCIEVDISYNPILKQTVIKHFPISFNLVNDEFYFKDFLEIIKQFVDSDKKQKPIIKLDFKNINGVERAIDMIKTYKITNLVDIWLNADILRGPGNPILSPLDKDLFLKYCQQLNNTTMSLGWTTGYHHFRGSDLVYTSDMIDEMLNITNKIKSPITFPIRGSLVRDSWSHLKKLLSRDRTITIWSGDEGISEEDLIWMNDKPISYFDIEKANKQFFNKYLLYIGFYELTIVFIVVLMLIYHLR